MKKIYLICFLVGVFFSIGCATGKGITPGQASSIPFILRPYIQDAQYMTVKIDCEVEECKYAYAPPGKQSIEIVAECRCVEGAVTEVRTVLYVTSDIPEK